MERNKIYQNWKSGERLSEEHKELAQHKAIQKNNLATTAVIAGVPLVVGAAASNPYVATQAFKTILAPTLAYETINEAAKRDGHDSVEQGIVNTLGGNNLPSNVKNQISTVLSILPRFHAQKVDISETSIKYVCRAQALYW